MSKRVVIRREKKEGREGKKPAEASKLKISGR